VVAVRNDPHAAVTIVAVAAGRDRPRATRSDVGARIAVDVAATRAEAAVAANAVLDESALTEVADVLATRVVEQWQAQVRHHVAAQPDTDDDITLDGGRDDPDAAPLRAYDATLLLALVTPQALLAIQIGDGDIVVRTIGGETLRPVAGATTAGAGRFAPSLAGTAADVRRSVVDRASDDVAMVLLATEGLANALDDPAGPAGLVSELADEVEANGVDQVEEQLPGRIAELARVGRDDITVALVFPTPYTPAAAPPIGATIVNPVVAVAAAATGGTAATSARPAAVGTGATSEQPAVGAGSTSRGRRRWLLGAAIAGTALLAVGLAFALTRDNGSPAPASTVPPAPTPTTSHPAPSVAATAPTRSPVIAATLPPATTPPTVAPTTAPVVTTPTTAKPAPTTTPTTRPRATTTTTTKTTTTATTTTTPVTPST
jgi:hypothetical protein